MGRRALPAEGGTASQAGGAGHAGGKGPRTQGGQESFLKPSVAVGLDAEQRAGRSWGKHQHPVAYRQGLADIVGDHHHGDAVFLGQPAHQRSQRLAGGRVQGRERFIQQQHAGSPHQGAGQGDPLGHATRKQVRPPISYLL